MNLPAFVVLHDTTLEQISRVKPKSMAELRRISGMGEVKSSLYGAELLQLVQRFESGERAQRDWQEQAVDPSHETLQLLKQGHSFIEIARIRGRKLDTIISLIANLVETGQLDFDPKWVEPSHYDAIQQVANARGTDLLRHIKAGLPATITLEEIRLVVADLRRHKK